MRRSLYNKKKQNLEMSGGKMNSKHSITPLLNESVDGTTISYYYFSDGLLAEILKRLPVKSLVRCRCVQKSWYYLIQSPFFINLHLNYQQKPALLLFNSIYSASMSLRFDDERCQQYFKLKKHPNVTKHPHPAWYATSYGLVCLSNMFSDVRSYYRGDIYLWNPLIHKCITLPDPPLTPLPVPEWDFSWGCLAFGFSPKINDYLVIYMVNYSWKNKARQVIRSTMICIYSLITNSWRQIHQDHDFVRMINIYDWVFVHGAAFWRATTKERVVILMCFDTKNDVLLHISLPEIPTAGWCNPSLHQFGDSVAYFVEDVEWNAFNIWVLRDASGNEFVWEKKITVDIEVNIKPEVLGMRNNGEILLSKDNEYGLISYNVDKDEPKDFVDSWNHWYSPAAIDAMDMYVDDPPTPFTIYPFLESLTLLDH